MKTFLGLELRHPISWALFCVGFLLLGFYGFCLWPHLTQMPITDEPLQIYQSWMTSKGQLPYRDFWAFTTPGTFYLNALVIKLSGGLSFFSLRLVALLFWIGTLWLSLLIAKPHLKKTSLVLLATFLWSHLIAAQGLLQVNHHLYSTFFALLAVWLLQRALNRTAFTRQSLLYAGLALGGCLLFTQTLGLLLWFSLLVYLTLNGLLSKLSTRQILNLLLTISLPPIVLLVAVLFYFFRQNALNDLLYNTVFWLKEGGYAQTTSTAYLADVWLELPAIVSSVFQFKVSSPAFWVMGFALVRQFFLVVLPIAGLFTCIGITIKAVQLLLKKTIDSLVPLAQFLNWLLLACSGLAFFVATLSNANVYLVSFHSGVLAILALLSLQQWTQDSRQRKKLLTEVILFCSLLLIFQTLGTAFLIKQGMAIRSKVVSYGSVEKLLNANVTYNSADLNSLNTVTQTLNRVLQKEDTLFVYNWSPALYYYLDKPSLTRYPCVMSLLHQPKQLAQLQQDLTQYPPTMILYDHSDELFFKTDYRAARLRNYDYQLTLLKVIEQKSYQPLFSAGRYLVFVRNDQVQRIRTQLMR